MINYFLANGRADVIYPYTEAMEPFGIFYLATVSAFFPEMRAYPQWARSGKRRRRRGDHLNTPKAWPATRASSATTPATNAPAKLSRGHSINTA